MDNDAPSAAGSLDAACARVSVAESFVTVAVEIMPLRDALGTRFVRRWFRAWFRDVKDAPLSTHPEGRVLIP
jgi:hypothetical protein